MKRVSLTLVFVWVVSLAAGQSSVTGDFRDMRFEQFVEKIEGQTAFRFFYKRQWTDSLRVNAAASNTPLDQLLSEIFRGTDLQFAIDGWNRVFVTKGRRIATDLASGFFEAGPEKSKRQEDAFDFSDYEKRERKKQIAETRLFAIGAKTTNMDGKATIGGSVRDASTGEPVIGATVFIERPMIGVSTDQFGYFAINLPKGRHELKIKSIGMKPTVRQIMLYGDGKLDILLEQDVTPLKEVVVESQADARLTNVQMGAEKLDMQTMKQIPLALGETDIMKVVLTLPGVQSVGEGTVGINVRGGATNQNLILLNDAVVYNPSHLFGFFSTFNPDILK
ncbi:MAG TPA: carboxypeptidase-like regulatory domain-containing protein, partial [Chryseosolibacter sp.]|nr:carboxypeptidase-like regulatory domain-containing protein [Chryseosolibacter sp.]